MLLQHVVVDCTERIVALVHNLFNPPDKRIDTFEDIADLAKLGETTKQKYQEFDSDFGQRIGQNRVHLRCFVSMACFSGHQEFEWTEETPLNWNSY